MENPVVKPLRTIRSFVRRLGRVTSGQERALETLWPVYGIEYEPEAGPLNLEKIFGRNAPVMLDIGFGRGESTLAFAKNHPDWNILGVEVHLPGVGHLLQNVQEEDITNLRVIRYDVIEVLQHLLASQAIQRVQLFFPDPWHKKRHHKRRLVQPSFIELLLPKLAPQAVLFFATDWQEYAQHMLEVFEQFPCLQNKAGANLFIPRPDDRPLTKFEKRGQRLGHDVWDLCFLYEGE